jgi:hypothetical protein
MFYYYFNALFYMNISPILLRKYFILKFIFSFKYCSYQIFIKNMVIIKYVVYKNNINNMEYNILTKIVLKS